MKAAELPVPTAALPPVRFAPFNTNNANKTDGRFCDDPIILLYDVKDTAYAKIRIRKVAARKLTKPG